MYIAAIINPDIDDILFIDEDLFVFYSDFEENEFDELFKSKEDAIKSIKDDIEKIYTRNKNTDSLFDIYSSFFTSPNYDHYIINIIKPTNLKSYIRKIKIEKLLKCT